MVNLTGFMVGWYEGNIAVGVSGWYSGVFGSC